MQHHPFVRLVGVLLLVVAGLASLSTAEETVGRRDGPVLRATVLRPCREKSIGLDTQLTALRPERGQLLVSTADAPAPSADFELRFSWRGAKDPKSSEVAPSMLAADVETARAALRTAMSDSYSAEVSAAVVVKPPENAADRRWEVVFPAPHSGASLSRQFRVARRLIAARMVDLKMGDLADGTWPKEFRPEKALALYDADGVGYYGSTLLDRAVNETTLDARTVVVCPEDIREGILDRCIGVLFPGGSGKNIAVALRPEGVRRVRDFVANGGGYFGVCAGAYLAASGLPEYIGMLPLVHDQPWAKGHSTLKVGLTPDGVAVFGKEFQNIETNYNCGPVFRDLEPNGQRAPVTVLANFDSPATDSKKRVHEEMVGTPAILSMPFQKGRIMIISPHPEGYQKYCPLVARAICWTLGKDPQAVVARATASANTPTVDAEKPPDEAETPSPSRAQP
jgi:putative intracellular protease/amidase